MANENKRIIQLPTAPQVEDNDYIALDNTSTPTAENDGGSRKILAKDVMAKSADAVDYDNTASGLEADNVQDAIDEVLEEGGKVQDVKVNGVSVLDNNKTAQIVSYKEVTQAEYDALPSSKLTDGIMYCIKDADFSAEDVPYDNTDSGLESEDVQSAVDEIADVLGALKVKGTASGSIATFTDGSNLPMPSLKVGIEPIQSGSGDPSPTNIRPISGWTACKLTVSGVNGWDEEWEVGNINDGSGEDLPQDNVIRTKGYIRVMSGNSYYIKCPTTGISRLFLYAKDKSFITYVPMDNIINNIYTVPNNCEYIRFRTLAAYGTTYNNDISINYPSTDTEYHAYNGATYTIDLNGTRYGGTLDVVSGELVVDRAYVDLGSLSWSVINAQNGIFGATVNGLKTYSYGNTPNMLCSSYKVAPSSYNDPYISANEIIWTYVDVSAIRIKDTEYTDATAFKTAVTGQQLVYELATPITIQLTPTQVNSLVGVNNIWADCGEINNATYIRDLNIVINNLLNG